MFERADRAFNRACQRRGGPIVDHMATADVARDLDLLRQAVGDRQLTYAGYSYGSFLGITYANLFPHRVRALVLDGVVDPIAWTTGRGDEAETEPVYNRLGNPAGAQATLEEFFRLCDAAGSAGCAVAGNSDDRFAALAERLAPSHSSTSPRDRGAGRLHLCPSGQDHLGRHEHCVHLARSGRVPRRARSDVEPRQRCGAGRP